MRFLLVEDNIDLGEAIESKLRNAGQVRVHDDAA